jgi:hypothetical protein
MPAQGSPTYTGSALEAMSSTSLNRSSQVTILSACSLRTTVCPRNVYAHLSASQIACFCRVAARLYWTTALTSLVIVTLCRRIISRVLDERRENTQDWQSCCLVVGIMTVVSCEMVIDTGVETGGLLVDGNPSESHCRRRSRLRPGVAGAMAAVSN